MDYISTSKAALKWNCSERTVIYYASLGRIPGARKFNQNWQIPEDAEKPLDRRRRKIPLPSHQQKNKAAIYNSWPVYGPHALSTISFSPGKADETIIAITDDMLREELWAELSYLRGHFENAEKHLKKVRESSRKDLLAAAWFHTIENAVHLRNYEMVLHALAQLNKIVESRREEDDIVGAKVAELSIDTFLVVTTVTQNCHEWLKKGDFNGLPNCCLVDAAYARCKYLQVSGRLEEMLSEYRMATALIGDNPFWRGYPAIMAILGYVSNNQLEMANQLARITCQNLLPDACIVPIADDISYICNLFLKHIDTVSPSSSQHLMQIGQEYVISWHEIVNLMAGRNITVLLTLKEYEIAWLAAQGMTNKEIAAYLGLSINSIKPRLQTVYEKLNITSRKELEQFITSG